MAEKGEKWRKNGDHVKNNTSTVNYTMLHYTHTFGIIVACTKFGKMRQMFEMIFPKLKLPEEIFAKNSIQFALQRKVQWNHCFFFLGTVSPFYMCTIDVRSYRLFQCVWCTYHIQQLQKSNTSKFLCITSLFIDFSRTI